METIFSPDARSAGARQWLATNQVSQTRFAADLDVHFTTLTGWLRGHSVPRVRLWAALERATAGAVPALAWTQAMPKGASDGAERETSG